MTLCVPGLGACVAIGAGEHDLVHCCDGPRPSSSASVASPRVLERPCASGLPG